MYPSQVRITEHCQVTLFVLHVLHGQIGQQNFNLRKKSSATPALIGHPLVWEAAQDKYTRKAASVAGCHAWHFNHQNYFAADHSTWQCERGGWRPSRPHVTWSCEATNGLRQGIRVPCERGEESALMLAMHSPDTRLRSARVSRVLSTMYCGRIATLLREPCGRGP